MKTKKIKKRYALHWKLFEPYNFFIIVGSGPDLDGIKAELKRYFKRPKTSNEPLPHEFLDNAIDPAEMHTMDGRCIFDEKSDNIVIYIKELRPALPTLAHELYHAIRNSARNFGFEQSRHDEAEAYLFERAFEYFAPMSAEWRKPRR